MAMKLEVVENGAALASAAAAHFLRLGQDAVASRGVFRVALAGGETPRAAYGRIADAWSDTREGALAWEKVHLFWGDERMVPPGDPRSNFGMALGALISRVPVPEENVHPIPTDSADPGRAATRYEETLHRAFGLGGPGLGGPTPGAMPRFDLVLLGMGADGHTASLFPGSPALGETSRLVTAARHPETGQPRVTLTLPVLNNAAALIVLVSGESKASMLERGVRGVGRQVGTAPLPIERLNPETGTLLWLADESAAPWARSARGG
jgi:6-phosphogluconolactonase